MEKLHSKNYPGTPFSVEALTVEHTDGSWDSTKISIFRDGILIGEYMRNYNAYGALTFCPFRLGDDWYALYSAHYTATRVMKLHNDRIEDWCGQEPSEDGFCPTEIYIPRYRTTKHSVKINETLHEFDNCYVDCDFKSEKEFDEEIDGLLLLDEQHTSFGFISGCVWEDDSSWKIQYIDLTGIADKILNISDKFGYWEMPHNLSLRECVDMSDWEPEYNCVSLTGSKRFNLG
jgi:hypothetical protein